MNFGRNSSVVIKPGARAGVPGKEVSESAAGRRGREPNVERKKKQRSVTRGSRWEGVALLRFTDFSLKLINCALMQKVVVDGR